MQNQGVDLSKVAAAKQALAVQAVQRMENVATGIYMSAIQEQLKTGRFPDAEWLEQAAESSSEAAAILFADLGYFDLDEFRKKNAAENN